MASIGLRRPYIALYECTNGNVTYKDGLLFAKAIEYSSEIEASEDNNLYADDEVAESDRTFSKGSITVTIDDISQDASTMILGSIIHELEVGTDTVKEIIYDDDINSPYLGFGVIIPKKKKGALLYRAIVLTKIQLNIPNDAATTKGESIEWQTQELSGSIMRDDSSKHRWKRETTVDTFELAEAYIKQCLNIEETPNVPKGGS